MKKNRAFLKWAGGKYPLLDDIKRHLPKGECLVEPFVGAGSVFLNTDFSRYILADINSDLISLYNIVKLRTDERSDKSSVVYCDPPYAPLSATANFTAYHTNSFSLTQQAHLAEIAENLVSNRIPVLISNHDTALTREWYQLAKLHVVKVRRSISSNGGTRKKVDELLALYQPGVATPARK